MRVPRLFLVGRVLQQFKPFLLRRLLLFRGARKLKVPERLLFVEPQPVRKRKLRIHAMSQHDVTKLVRQYCREARLVRKHVNQSSAKHNRVAYGERLKRRRHQHAAAYFWLDVQIIRRLQVVHHRLQYLIYFSSRRQQALPLQAVRDVVFGPSVPRTLCLDRRVIAVGLRLILHRAWRLHEHFTQLLFRPHLTNVVAPKTRLRPECLESQVPCLCVVHAAVFDIHRRRHPQVRPHVHPPAIEIEVVTRRRCLAIRSIESHDAVIAILHPDAPHKTPFARLR